MNIKLLSTQHIESYELEMEYDGKKYFLTIYCDDQGKFIDWIVKDENGYTLENEGSEGEIVETLINWADENFDTFC